ncbi:hypothetical protein GCM10010140_46800 [Streptosporangium pseudovulgare]|uniref:Uncharacterized protein n=1 Tax=Streptosporangium pseudovulgare TaxID=35765 RepID=A0ABQ2R3Y9_9ACTN|nr:hypothetical protein GCM10010140_46800 [Streptosporangium pseudovulgare]
MPAYAYQDRWLNAPIHPCGVDALGDPFGPSWPPLPPVTLARVRQLADAAAPAAAAPLTLNRPAPRVPGLVSRAAEAPRRGTVADSRNGAEEQFPAL